jgi:hypothetical protein
VLAEIRNARNLWSVVVAQIFLDLDTSVGSTVANLNHSPKDVFVNAWHISHAVIPIELDTFLCNLVEE